MSNAIRWTPEQLAAHNTRNSAAHKALRAATAVKRFQALGRLPKDQMNKTERAYAGVLNDHKLRGEVLDWKFHPMRVRLAENTFYEIDFLVVHGDRQLAIHEVKGGFTTDKGQMKIKLCAEALPWFRFIKASKQPKKLGGGWKIEEF